MHTCEKCKYKTNFKSNWNRHVKSKRHKAKSHVKSNHRTAKSPVDTPCKNEPPKLIEKSEHAILPEQSDKNLNQNIHYICVFCRKILCNKSSLTRHEKICPKKTELDEINNLKMDLKLKELLLKHKEQLFEQKELNFKQELKYKEETFKKELRKKNKLLKEKDSKIENNDKYIKSLLSNLNKTGNNNINNINYIMINYNEAPAIKPINISKIKLLHYSHENILLLMQHCKAKTLNELLVKTIVNEFKKENPKLQSIWSTDPSRNNFIIREKNNEGEIKWLIDKAGNKMATYTIKPAIDALETNLTKFTYDSSAAKTMQPRHYDICIEKGIYMFQQIKLGYLQKNLTTLLATSIFHSYKNN